MKIKGLIKVSSIILLFLVISPMYCNCAAVDRYSNLNEIIKIADKIVPGLQKQWTKEKHRREHLKEMLNHKRMCVWNDNCEKREEENENIEFEKEELIKKYKRGELSVLEYSNAIKKIEDRCSRKRYEKNKEWVIKRNKDRSSLKVYKEEMSEAIKRLQGGIVNKNKREIKKNFNKFLDMYKETNKILEKKIEEGN